MPTKIAFKNTLSEKRWLELHKQKSELQAKSKTAVIENKINLISSLMTSCKVGFNLTEAKVKKITKILNEKTALSKIKYSEISKDSKQIENFLFKDILINYVVVDDCVFFHEKK